MNPDNIERFYKETKKRFPDSKSLIILIPEYTEEMKALGEELKSKGVKGDFRLEEPNNDKETFEKFMEGSGLKS